MNYRTRKETMNAAEGSIWGMENGMGWILGIAIHVMIIGIYMKMRKKL